MGRSTTQQGHHELPKSSMSIHLLHTLHMVGPTTIKTHTHPRPPPYTNTQTYNAFDNFFFSLFLPEVFNASLFIHYCLLGGGKGRLQAFKGIPSSAHHIMCLISGDFAVNELFCFAAHFLTRWIGRIVSHLVCLLERRIPTEAWVGRTDGVIQNRVYCS